MECYEIKKTICKELGDKRGYGIVIGNMGNVYWKKCDYHKAIECFEKAIARHQEINFKYGLTYWFEGKARCLLELKQFFEAKKLVANCIKLSTELSKPDTLFSSNVLLAKIDFALGHHEKAVTMLTEMLANTEDKSEIADLNYELWEMETGERKRERGEKALKLYRELYEKTLKFEYKKRIEELT